MKYYLIAGEPSGDSLGGRLMQALKQKDPNAEFIGIGGDNMQEQGLKSLFDISELAVMGIAEVIPSIPRILKRIKQTVDEIERTKPDAVITIDSWSFCARIHKKIRALKLGIPQIHYVAPQVWAWKKRRARTMYKYIDLLLTLFPNEPKYFTPYHLDTVFVGHPVIESAIVNNSSNGLFKKEHNIEENKRIMLILPGSRHNEVQRLLPDFMEAAKIVQRKFTDIVFVIPTVSTVAKRVKQMVRNYALPVIIVEGQDERSKAFCDSSVAVAASGTVALELAIINVPHIIAYKVPKLTEILARCFLHIKFVNLTNLLLNRLVVPELLQQECNPKNIASYVIKFLTDAGEYQRQKQGFEEARITLGFGRQTPSENAAQAIINKINALK